MIQPLLRTITDKGDIEPDALRDAFGAILSGQCSDAEIAGLLTALRMKGESPTEIVTVVTVLREHMVSLETGGLDVLDTCGTGGDSSGTFNISTATAIVVASCGTPIVKHGNRAVSSISGSSDVLTALGVRIDPEIGIVEKCLKEIGLTFCFAPRFHPAMKHVAATRQALGFRTIFNLLGPLLNPARANRQLIGVGHPALLEILSESVAQLNMQSVYLVHGQDGLDEVTLGGPTRVKYVNGSEICDLEWNAGDFGLPRVSLEQLRVGSAEESAVRIRAIVTGEHGPARDVILANSAATLLAAGKVADLHEGVTVASEAIDVGRAARTLDRFVELTNA